MIPTYPRLSKPDSRFPGIDSERGPNTNRIARSVDTPLLADRVLASSLPQPSIHASVSRQPSEILKLYHVTPIDPSSPSFLRPYRKHRQIDHDGGIWGEIENRR